jgi:5-methyltetrahydrofolate--homocysteine methyltransferase
MSECLEAISQGVTSGDSALVVSKIGQALEAGITAGDILHRALIPGIQVLGKLFKDGEAYLPEILISTRAMNSGIEQLRPHLSEQEMSRKGVVVIGTVEGDMHDIGKNLVKLMLDSNGFTVHDIGVDVSPDTFVKETQVTGADIVAVSALLTTTMLRIPEIVQALGMANLRDRVKIMIGGAPVTRAFASSIGVEGYADDCASAVDEAEQLMKQAGEK